MAVSRGQAPPPSTPLMPIVWTQQTVRALSPARLGRGVRLDILLLDRGLELSLTQPSPGRFERFPGTPAGWLSAWARAAEWSRPDAFAKAVRSWSDRVRVVQSPKRRADLTVELDAQMPPILYGLAFLGGHGYGDHLKSGAIVDLRRASDGIALTDVMAGTVGLSVPAGQLTSAEASGPGKTATGAFAATVGHGLLGDLIDQQAAQWMNDRFARSQIRTTMRICATTCELFLVSASDLPEHAQVAPSAVRALVPVTTRQSQPAGLLAGIAAARSPSDAEVDLVTMLERLARLRDSGALTPLEFQAAKDKLLG